MPSPASRKLIRSRVRHVTCFSSHLAVPGGAPWLHRIVPPIVPLCNLPCLRYLSRRTQTSDYPHTAASFNTDRPFRDRGRNKLLPGVSLISSPLRISELSGATKNRRALSIYFIRTTGIMD